MRLQAFGAVLAALVGAGASRADTLPLVVNAPATYTPGAPFSFELHAPGLIGLSGYNVTIQLESGPNPPALTVSATPPPGLTNYPFPDSTNFGVGVLASPFPTPYTFQVSDSSSGSPVATAGGNDYLALVTVTPDAALTTPITVTVTAATFSAFHLPGEPQSTLPVPVTIAPDLSVVTPVPTPGAWLMLTFGALGSFALRSRLGRAVG